MFQWNAKRRRAVSGSGTHTHTIAYGENKLSATSIERLGILLRVVSLGLISVLVERRTRKIYVIFCASFPMRFVRKMLIRKWRIVRDRGTYYAHATNIIHENESLRMISIHTKERKLFLQQLPPTALCTLNTST